MKHLPALPEKFTNAAFDLWESKPVALFAVAHCDDAEVRFGGTMLKMVEEGWRVYIAVFTLGEKSCVVPSLKPAAIAKIRRQEQLAAAKLAGVKEVFFFDFPDGDLEFHKKAAKERLVWVIRKVRPHTIGTYDPSQYYMTDDYPRLNCHIVHPDHRAIGEVSLSAVYCGSSLHHYYPEHMKKGLAPWSVQEMLLAGSPRPNYKLDLRRYFKRKEALLDVYKSQSPEGLKLGLDFEGRFHRLVSSIPGSYQKHLREREAKLARAYGNGVDERSFASLFAE